MYLGFDIGEGLGPSGLHKILQWFDMSHTFPLYDVPLWMSMPIPCGNVSNTRKIDDADCGLTARAGTLGR